MTAAERIAKTFVDIREALAASLDRDVIGWDEMDDDFGKPFHIRVFEQMLERRLIAVPERVTQRDIFAAPHEVAKDAREIESLLGGLDAMYARAHDDVLSQSGSGEVSGRGSLAGVDPTGEHASDPRRERARAAVRKVATQVREARNLLYVARRSLREQTETTTLQPKRVDTKALIPQEQLDAALARKAAEG